MKLSATLSFIVVGTVVLSTIPYKLSAATLPFIVFGIVVGLIGASAGAETWAFYHGGFGLPGYLSF